jgi:oligoribonuclease
LKIVSNNMMVWIDCEMTGLDYVNDALVEVAVLVTDGELNVQGEGLDIVIKTDEAKLDAMGDFVREMHTKSGLIDEIRAATTTMREAEEQILAYVKQYVPNPRKAPLAGNSIGTDRTFLNRDMPELEGWVHYRNVDVSTIKELAKRWFPKAFHSTPLKQGNHRALADIQESIEELRYYREAIFVPSPGPSGTEAKLIAARHQGELTGLSAPDA